MKEKQSGSNGIYYISKDEATGNTYHFCVIKDALACCAQGLEFVRKMRKNCRMKIIRNRKQKLSFRERSRHIKNQMMRLCIAGSQMRYADKKIRREKMDHEGIREKD